MGIRAAGPPILKLPMDRCVCAPQYTLDATAMDPIVSFSMRVAPAADAVELILRSTRCISVGAAGVGWEEREFGDERRGAGVLRRASAFS